MATTTNYSWSTPDDTALVKDGASAIRTLGSSIDTTVFNNANAAINKTIVDAKGDIIAATAADTVARLAVGANDTVLIADSTTATGLKWGTPSATPTFYGCQLYKTGSQSTATNTNVEITWDSEQVDVGGFHDNVTNNGRITIPSGRAGKYLFIAQISWAATSTTGYRRHYIYKNGSSIASALQPGMSGTSTEQTLITSLVDTAAVGDYYQVFAFQNTGSALLVENAIGKSAFSAVYLGA